jgi:predicted Zn-dependent protease
MELETTISEQRNAVRATQRMQGEIYNNLYRYNEEGFKTAIKELNELLKSDESNPALWVYLAAAHGQAHKWEREHTPESADKSRVLKEHRDAALSAVKKALLISDTWEPTLKLLWDKNHPAKQDGTAKDEDDLEEFYNDPDFRRLLSS